MKKMRCLIVDDDLMARRSLEILCQKVDFLSVDKLCENGAEAMIALKEFQSDLIFLDMEMPEVTGIEFLDAAPVLPQIIFFTGQKEFALQAFDYDVTDFLQKPTNFPRFKKAVDKAYLQFLSEENHSSTTAEKNEIYIKEDGKLCRIDQEDILYFENVGDYINVKTTRKSHIIHGTLKGLMEKIKNPQFMKIHRSFVINLRKIENIEDNSLLIDKKVIPISRANKPLLLSQLNLL